MALTDSLPTGDAGGLTVTDERLILSGLVAKNADGTPRVGILPSGTAPIVTGRASMGYDIGPFKAVTSRTGTGVELLANNAVTIVTTTTAPAANSRIDVIWVRPQFTANADTGNVPLFGVTQGTANAIPSKPAIPAGALELATAEIQSTTTTTATAVITQTHPYTAAAGGVVPVRSTTELAAFPAADTTRASDIGTGVVYWRSGGAWLQTVAGQPFAVASGQTTLGAGLANGANATAPITFPAGRFSVAPHVLLASNGIVYLFQGSVTATGFTLGIANRSGSALGTAPTVTWMAVQMTSASAAG